MLNNINNLMIFCFRLEIKAKEWEIMTALNFDISFPTYYNFFERFFWKSFNSDVNSNYIRSIEETGVYILRMILYSSSLMKFRPHILGLSLLNEYWFDEKGRSTQIIKKKIFRQKQRHSWIKTNLTKTSWKFKKEKL